MLVMEHGQGYRTLLEAPPASVMMGGGDAHSHSRWPAVLEAHSSKLRPSPGTALHRRDPYPLTSPQRRVGGHKGLASPAPKRNLFLKSTSLHNVSMRSVFWDHLAQ